MSRTGNRLAPIAAALAATAAFLAASCDTGPDSDGGIFGDYFWGISDAAATDPVEIERGRLAGVWHLEGSSAEAASLADISGVYWSARDLDSSPLGNHHFITVVWQSLAQAEAFESFLGLGFSSTANEAGLVVHFTTFGVQTDDGTASGRIKIEFNYASDIQAVNEVVNPDAYTSWYTWDFDYEGHLVPYALSGVDYASLQSFMKAVVKGAQNFNAHYDAGVTLPYSLVDTNCATLVNSQLSALGYSPALRETLGEFFGVDWGEEDLVGAEYFDTDLSH